MPPVPSIGEPGEIQGFWEPFQTETGPTPKQLSKSLHIHTLIYYCKESKCPTNALPLSHRSDTSKEGKSNWCKGPRWQYLKPDLFKYAQTRSRGQDVLSWRPLTRWWFWQHLQWAKKSPRNRDNTFTSCGATSGKWLLLFHVAVGDALYVHMVPRQFWRVEGPNYPYDDFSSCSSFALHRQ